LTQEGFVFIRDTLTPGKTAQGWTPGCTLTLPGATLRARGERWFASAPRTEIPLASDEPSRERGLCVRFFGPETLSCDAQKRPTPSGQSWLAWSKLPPIRSEAPLSTLTVLVPTLPSTRLPELASRILAREVPLGSEAFVRTGNQTLEVHLGERSWSVRRTEPPNR
jgi:hypothetical protein